MTRWEENKGGWFGTPLEKQVHGRDTGGSVMERERETERDFFYTQSDEATIKAKRLYVKSILVLFLFLLPLL